MNYTSETAVDLLRIFSDFGSLVEIANLGYKLEQLQNIYLLFICLFVFVTLEIKTGSYTC